MASIITATTTSGLTQSADNSGVLQLASGVGNLVTVPAVTGTAMVSGAMPAFSAWQSSAQTLSSATFTKITFDTELWDTNSNFASSRFTPTVAGYYQINCGLYTVTGQSTFVPVIYKNGTSYKQGFQGGTVNGVGVGGVVYCNGTTDYIEIYAYMGTGATLLTVNSSYTWFDGTMVRAA
jgi:hypothetical protein